VTSNTAPTGLKGRFLSCVQRTDQPREEGSSQVIGIAPDGIDSHPDASESENAPCRTRTYNPLIKSQPSPFLKFPSENDLQPDDPAACRPACRSGPADGDLARVVAAWDELPEAICAAVLLLVDSAGKRP
jgi:hypothetical protein